MFNKKILITSIVIGSIVWIGSIVSSSADGVPAANMTPGSIDDPVITKSYVDQQVQAIVTAELAKQNGDQTKLLQMISDEVKKQLAAAPSSGGGSAGIKVVKMQAGDTLYGKAGAQFIVRTGKLTAVSGDASGIPDVTLGKDIAAGTIVGTNHLLIFPRDGRGVKAPAKITGDIYVMVMGGYVLQDLHGNDVVTP